LVVMAVLRGRKRKARSYCDGDGGGNTPIGDIKIPAPGKFVVELDK
jgi:hypothetical protein